MMMTFGEMLISIFGKVKMILIVVIVIFMVIPLLLCIIGFIKINSDEDYKDDVKYCYNCQEGFCMDIPKSKECKKHRKVINK